MLRRNTCPKGYISLTNIIEECKRNGIKVPFNSLKWRIGNGKILSIRDPYDVRKRRLVSLEEIPKIIEYYSLRESIKNEKYHSLSELAKRVGLKEKSLHTRADRMGIATIKLGNKRVMEKREYDKWRIILGRKQIKGKDYVSTEYVGRKLGISRHLVIYRIKRGTIPAVKIDNKYKILKKDFGENGEEWRRQCRYPNNKV